MTQFSSPAAEPDASGQPSIAPNNPPSESAIARLHVPFPIATALRKALAAGYGLKDLRADILAGLVVGIVALPLSMALAIAVGAPPQHGLYTAIVAGFVAALLGGSAFQVTGPTAAFVVILAPIVNKYGLSGLLTAGFVAGIMLVALGWLRLGGLMRYIPAPVTIGFTTGIATVIATLQIKDVLGLKIARMPEAYHEKLETLYAARASFDWHELVIAAATMALLLTIPRVIKRIPAPLVAIGTVSLVVALVRHLDPGFSVATIGSRFHSIVDGVDVAGIPPILPRPAFPWSAGGMSFGVLRELMMPALAITVLGAIESLLSAVIADGMTGDHHDPDAELVGQGFANMLAPLFGGIAATGALARTATNIRAGARSPIASAVHAVVVLLAILVLAPAVAYVPMASLAALLLLVAWNMSEIKHFIGTVKIAPKSDVSVLIICFLLTVIFDMVIAISVGFTLAAVLFMRRMAVLTDAKWLTRNVASKARTPLPDGVVLYQINGPLFFGAVHNAMGALHASSTDSFKVLILDLGHVPVIDATGYAALETVISGLSKRNRGIVLAGPLPKPLKIWEKARITERYHHVYVADNMEAAVAMAVQYMGGRAQTGQFAVAAPASPPR